MKIKKIICLVLALLTVLSLPASLVGCFEGGGSGATSDDTSDDIGGSDDGGSELPPERPDYGTATVYMPGDRVLFITSNFNQASLDIKTGLEGIVGEGKVVIGSIYNENEACEVLFNVQQEDDSRPAIKAAREALAKLERPSHYTPRYVIYADSGAISVCFDEVELTNLYVGDYVASIFIEKIISGKENIALAEGVVESGTIDLISIQEKIDEENDKAAWESFLSAACEKYGDEVGREFYDAFKTFYSMFSEDLYYWYADLYDPGVGGFYASSSGRDSAGYLPLVETSGQVWGQLVGMGLFKETGKSWGNAIPDIIKYQMIYFFKSCQDKNGFFYPPQMEKSALDQHVASRSRNTNRAVSALRSLGSMPTYATAMGNSGDGITADKFWQSLIDEGKISADTPKPYVPRSYDDYVEHLTGALSSDKAEAVSRIVLTDSTSDSMQYLTSHKNFAAYLNKLNIDGSRS